MKVLKKRKGFTMIEIVVSLLIAGMIMSFAGTWLLSSGKYLNLTANKNEVKLIGDKVLDFMTQKIKYCGNIKISQAGLNYKYDNSFASTDSVNNMLLFNDNNIFTEQFYSGASLNYTTEVLRGDCLKIGITVEKDNHEYKTDTVVELGNISFDGNSIEYDTSDVLINPFISFENAKTSIFDQYDEYIPGTDVPLNSTWPNLEDFYDDKGHPKAVLIEKGSTFYYEGKYYIVPKMNLNLYMSMIHLKPTPENFKELYPWDLIEILPPPVMELEDDITRQQIIDKQKSPDGWEIKRGSLVHYRNNYYVYIAISNLNHGDIPERSSNFVKISL